jgi:hypothetical protein
MHPGVVEASLVKKCKQQEVVFETFSLYVIRIKLPTPTAPGSDSTGPQRFITRMRDTDFFQALSMYIPPPPPLSLSPRLPSSQPRWDVAPG